MLANDINKTLTLNDILALRLKIIPLTNNSVSYLKSITTAKIRLSQLKDVLLVLKRREDLKETAKNYLNENDFLKKELENVEQNITNANKKNLDLLSQWKTNNLLVFLGGNRNIKITLLGSSFWNFINSYSDSVKEAILTDRDLSFKVKNIIEKNSEYDKKIIKLGSGKVPISVQSILTGYKTVITTPLRWVGIITLGIAGIYLLPKVLFLFKKLK